jgi:hypothetical protein
MTVTNTKSFYVYLLSSEGKTFYVGKGSGDRIKHTVSLKASQQHLYKNRKIALLRRQGKQTGGTKTCGSTDCHRQYVRSR